jgi:hypothetical protein
VVQLGLGSMGEGMDLTCRGPRVSGMGTRRRFGGRHNSENKTYYQEYAEAFGPTGPGEGQSGLQRGGERGGTGWPSRRTGLDPREDSRKH